MNSFSKRWDVALMDSSTMKPMLVNAFHEKGFGSRCYSNTCILLYPSHL